MAANSLHTSGGLRSSRDPSAVRINSARNGHRGVAISVQRQVGRPRVFGGQPGRNSKTCCRRGRRRGGQQWRGPRAAEAGDEHGRTQTSTAVPQIPQTSSCRRPHRAIGTKTTMTSLICRTPRPQRGVAAARAGADLPRAQILLLGAEAEEEDHAASLGSGAHRRPAACRPGSAAHHRASMQRRNGPATRAARGSQNSGPDDGGNFSALVHTSRPSVSLR
jgi:hypothetical protein